MKPVSVWHQAVLQTIHAVFNTSAKNRCVVCMETQRVIWEGRHSIPEVHISDAVQVQSLSSVSALEGFLCQYLKELDTTFNWSDVRPTEECARCGDDLDTSIPHRVISVTVEQGPEMDPTVLDGWYAARFCPRCEPI
jgi:hypothetical protein